MRILLLTPYTGGNLGDAAIQEAVISAVRRRHPDAEIVLVSLSPTDTGRLHGVRSFPLGTITIGPGFPTEALPDSARLEAHDVPSASNRPFFRRAISAVPGPIKTALRQMLRWSGALELRHIGRAARIVRTAQMIIVSGGGQLDDYWGGPWRQPYALLKWTLLGRLAGASVVFLSVGTCTLKPLSRLLLRWTLPLASYRSFRDHGSRALASFFAGAASDPVVPDLVFSYPTPRTRNDGAVAGTPTVGISPIAYLSRIWPESDSAVYDRYVASLANLARHLIERGCRVIFFTSDSSDVHAVCDVVGQLKDRGLSPSQDTYSVAQTLLLPDLKQVLRQCDFVVASRLHGILLSHVFETPSVAISYDRKVKTYMTDAGQEEFCLDIHALRDAELRATADRMMMHVPNIRDQLASNLRCYRRVLESQYDGVLRAIACRDPQAEGLS